jgi:hypothetical protein
MSAGGDIPDATSTSSSSGIQHKTQIDNYIDLVKDVPPSD